MRVNKQRRLGVVVVAGVCAVALAGCGSSGSSTGDSKADSSSGSSSSGSSGEGSKSPSQVVDDSKSALFKTKAVHVEGEVSPATGPGVSLDVHFQGQDAKGTLTLGGSKVNIVRTKGRVYLKAPASFWTKSVGPKGAALSGKWIKSDAKKVPGLATFTLQGIAASLNSTDSPLKPKTSTGRVDGQKAIIVTQKDGSRLYVADSSANPVPLKIVNGGATKGSVRFTDYDKTQQIEPPAKAVTPQQAATSGTSGT